MTTKIKMENLKCSERSLLHIWRPHAPGKFGHISLELNNGCYISFWPANGTKSCQIKNDNCPANWYNTVEEETEKHGHPDTLSVYRLDAEAIKSWWEKFLLVKPEYNLRDQNCATVVYKALCVGSSWFLENTKACNGIKTPGRVYDYVRNGYNKNTRFGCGCSCKHCFSLKPYRCVGLFSIYIYKFWLCLVSVWQYMKRLISKPEGEQYINADPEPEDTVINLSQASDKMKDDTSNTIEESQGNEETLLQNYEDFIDIRSKETSELGKTICHPSEGDKNNISYVPMPSLTDENVRHRLLNSEN